MNRTIYPPLARFLVVGPPVLFSLWLGQRGVPVAARLATCVGLGAVLILLLARYQRRALS